VTHSPVQGLASRQAFKPCSIRFVVGWVTLSAIGPPLFAQTNYTPYQVSTYAGAAGRSGSSDGTGSGAQFFSPHQVALDANGNLYVADALNCTIRKIAPGGVVTTIAGTPGASGSADGPATMAQFNLPWGVAVDANGNVYVGDTSNCTIRRITPAGMVSTFAGTPGVRGYADGIGSAAQFFYPAGLAVDGSGNVYVADEDNFAIRKITPDGVVTTLAGSPLGGGEVDGTGSAVQFDLPTGVAVDGSGNVYVADNQNSSIRRVTPSGVVTTVAGKQPHPPWSNPGYADGIGYAAQFEEPKNVAVDASGNVFVTDSTNDTIREVTLNRVVTTLAGVATVSGSTDGIGAAAGFSLPWGIAVDSKGTLYIGDAVNNTIRVGVPAPPVVINAGGTATFNAVTVNTTSPTIQWQFNGTNLTDGAHIAGSTGPELVITSVSAANAGNYTSIASGAGGPTTNITGLSVVTSSTPGTSSSLSARAFVGTGDNILIGGFYISGSSSRTVLIQAIGPSLAASPYDVIGTLQKPALTIHQQQNGKDVVLYSNTGWGSSQVLLDAAASVYALPVLQPSSDDSELLLTLPPGGYTAEITGADGGTGVALCAIYQLP